VTGGVETTTNELVFGDVIRGILGSIDPMGSGIVFIVIELPITDVAVSLNNNATCKCGNTTVHANALTVCYT
jgi:hypothetical protein